MQRIFPLKGRVQNYAWGGKDFIPNLLGIESKENPFAEYWLGAHVNAPSVVVLPESEMTLIDFLGSDPEGILGASVFKKFRRLPYLFKVLDVHDMLSIQVHPSKLEAEKGFILENERGIALNASNRNYKDDNHKPEIMVALSEFWLLHGFLPKDELIETLETRDELRQLLGLFKKGGYKTLYQHIMNLSDKESDDLLKPLIQRILPFYENGELDKLNPDYWAAKAVSMRNDGDHYDRGIYSIYFFNILTIQKGDGIFQDAGVPHAYLQGQNMELMANSDNVLRGGLTPKHVDIPELLKHIIFEETHPQILKGEVMKNGIERVYKSKAPDFELSEIVLDQDKNYEKTAESVEVYILLEGAVKVRENEYSLELKKGEAFMAIAGSNFEISTKSYGSLYKASTPL